MGEYDGSGFEVSITGKPLAIEVENFAALLGRDAPIGDGFLGEVAEFGDEFLGIVFDVGEHVGHGVAFDFVGIDRLALFKVHADDIGIT